jgi:hypothetical protein
MKWMFPKNRNQLSDASPSVDFNSALPENDGDGGVCIAESRVKVQIEPGKNEADDDIRHGRVKTFDNPEDLIASLKQPW